MEQVLDYIQFGLKNFAISMAKNEDAVQDLIQDTCFLFIKNYEKYSSLPIENQKKVANRIMRNRFISNCRLLDFRPNVVTDSFIYYAGYVNDGLENVDVNNVKDFIEKSKDKGVKYFYLYYKGYKYTEIASMFGENLNNVKSKIRTGRAKIIKSMRLVR